jgi:ElaB/YqjD/DUF883 family membrane-anchored ribosome-binding protein
LTGQHNAALPHFVLIVQGITALKHCRAVLSADACGALLLICAEGGKMCKKMLKRLKKDTKKDKPIGSPQQYKDKYMWGLALLLLPAMLNAQNEAPFPTAPAAIVITGPGFLVSLIVGIILALAFQLILSNLSVATGLNLLGPAASKKNQNSSKSENVNGRSKDSALQSIQEGTRKVSSVFGIWALATASLSLFFASLLAARISLAGSAAAGAILGLSIWGLFYIVSSVLGASAVSSAIGAFSNLVTASMRSSYNAVSSMFKKSPAQEMADSAARITDSVRDELFGSGAGFRRQLQSYIQQLKPSMVQPEQIAKGIMGMLNEEEIKTVTSNNGQQAVLAFLQKGGLNKENSQAVMRGVQGAYAKVKQEVFSGKDTTSKAADSALRMAGMSGKEVDDTRRQLENYLRSTGKEQLNPEGIKHDIEALLRNPRAGAQSLKTRAGSIDKSTVATLLAQRKDISQEQANKIVTEVDQVLKNLTAKTGGTTAGVEEKVGGTMDAITAKIQGYLDSLSRPELRYEGVEDDLQRLFRDPKAGVDALLSRFKSMDRDTLKALIASRKDLSEQDAENILNRIESVRDEYINKAVQMKDEVARRVELVRDEAVRQADETRKTAAVAAWWMFAIAFVSGIAAMLGGIAGA